MELFQPYNLFINQEHEKTKHEEVVYTRLVMLQFRFKFDGYNNSIHPFPFICVQIVYSKPQKINE